MGGGEPEGAACQAASGMAQGAPPLTGSCWGRPLPSCSPPCSPSPTGPQPPGPGRSPGGEAVHFLLVGLEQAPHLLDHLAPRLAPELCRRRRAGIAGGQGYDTALFLRRGNSQATQGMPERATRMSTEWSSQNKGKKALEQQAGAPLVDSASFLRFFTEASWLSAMAMPCSSSLPRSVSRSNSAGGGGERGCCRSVGGCALCRNKGRRRSAERRGAAAWQHLCELRSSSRQSSTVHQNCQQACCCSTARHGGAATRRREAAYRASLVCCAAPLATSHCSLLLTHPSSSSRLRWAGSQAQRPGP